MSSLSASTQAGRYWYSNRYGDRRRRPQIQVESTESVPASSPRHGSSSSSSRFKFKFELWLVSQHGDGPGPRPRPWARDGSLGPGRPGPADSGHRVARGTHFNLNFIMIGLIAVIPDAGYDDCPPWCVTKWATGSPASNRGIPAGHHDLSPVLMMRRSVKKITMQKSSLET
jgi:hypothetical protein